jgi:hypothetical protein
MFLNDIKIMTSGTIEDDFIITKVWNVLVKCNENFSKNYPSFKADMKKIREKSAKMNKSKNLAWFHQDFRAITSGIDSQFVMEAASKILWNKMPKDRQDSYEEDRLTHFLTDDMQNNAK